MSPIRNSVMKFFALGIFHESFSLKPLKVTLGSFRIFFKKFRKYSQFFSPNLSSANAQFKRSFLLLGEIARMAEWPGCGASPGRDGLLPSGPGVGGPLRGGGAQLLLLFNYHVPDNRQIGWGGGVTCCSTKLNPILHMWFRDSCFTCDDGSSTIQVFLLT